MHTWEQSYAALGNSVYLTLIAALIPIIFFFVALTKLNLKGHVAGAITLLLSSTISLLKADSLTLFEHLFFLSPKTSAYN